MVALKKARAAALAEIAAARIELHDAFHTIIDIAEACLRRGGLSPTDEASLRQIITTCAAEDIAGQRLVRAERLFSGKADDDPLLRGPALAGEGLGQDAADALFDDFWG